MRILTLSLDLPLHPGDIPAFRTCIIDLAGREHECFHGHNNARDAADPYHRGYPLVQYAVRRGRAVLIGMEEGADAIRCHVLPELARELTFAGRRQLLMGYQFKEREWTLRMTDAPVRFGLQGWLALNADNYRQWKENENDLVRRELLGQALTGQLRAFAERFHFPAYKSIIAEVLEVHNQKRIRWHDTQLVRFDVLAQSNLLPPAGIGIGRATAFGFGEIKSEHSYRRYRQSQRNYLGTTEIGE